MKLFAAVITFALLAFAKAELGSSNDSALRKGKKEAEPSLDRALNHDDHDDYDYYQKYKGYHGKACRDDHHDYGDKGRDYHKYEHHTLEECFERCSRDRDCKQFEYSDHGNHCEIWHRHYDNYESKRGYYCFYKDY